MRSVRSVLALAALAACNATNFESVSSGVEAGTPPTPEYHRTLTDHITTTQVVVTGTTANCSMGQPCWIAPPGADSYLEDLYERPAPQGTLARDYKPSLDITSGDVGLTDNWLYYRINLVGVEPGSTLGSPTSLPHHYGLEINFDDDQMGDVIVDLTNPSLNLGVNWGTTGILAKSDQNETMGGPRPLIPDGPGDAGGGYEHNEFNQGQNLATGQPGGSTAVQGRIVGAAVEIAIYRPFFEGMTDDTVDALGIRPYADAGQVSTSQLYTHDDAARSGIGSPYPWLTMSGAPATCPSGNAGDDAFSAAQIAALESGTNVNTGILNPCYALGGIYLRDNLGTIHDLARQDTISVDVDLTMTKVDAVDPVAPGAPIVYTLTVTNVVNRLVTGVRIEDDLPALVQFVSASVAGCTYRIATHDVVCNLGSLAPNSSTSVIITVLSTVAGSVTNSATVTSNGDELTMPNNTDTETTTVMLLCGNGAVDPGEVCDDGDGTNGNGCDNNCRLSNNQPCTMDNQCSSGVCDPTSDVCEPANTCGNGRIEPANGEVCDDGNTAPNDGCETTCLRSLGQPCNNDNQCDSGECNNGVCVPNGTCGNGVLDNGEVCDDGDTTNGNGCDNNCRLSNGEDCNNDNQCSSGVCDPTSDVCEPANVCGNGHLEGAEVCDDGNTSSGDTCEPDCKLPDGEECDDDDDCSSGVCDNGVCEPANACGNGVVNPNEGCDDGNTTSNDGCSATCLVEDGGPCDEDDECQSGVCDPQSGTCGGGDTDGDSVFDLTDIDDDNDGILDIIENLDTDRDGVIDQLDLDSDNDGIPDATEAGHALRDNDGNFIMDCPNAFYGNNGFCDGIETAPDSGIPAFGSIIDTDQDFIPDARDLDSDNDSIPDLIESNVGCVDQNKDALCDGTDTDGDGIRSSSEAALTLQAFGTLAQKQAIDTDGDGAPDYRDLDSDADTVLDILETKHAALDNNKDGQVDATADSDSDGLRDVVDDSDLDQTGDDKDPDPAQFGGYLDGIVDTDGGGGTDSQDNESDGDGVWDGEDNCRTAQNPGQEDSDDDFIGDACDPEDGREWSLAGGCGGCSTDGSSGGSLVLMLGVLWGLVGRRRRVAQAVGTAAAMAVVALPGTVAAQNATVEGDFGTERFQLATDREGILDVESGSVRKHLELDMGLWLGYVNDPLVLNRIDSGREEVGSVVSDQVSAELLAAIGLWNRGQIGLVVPLVFLQNNDVSATNGPMIPSGSFALGDIRLVPKLSLMKQGDYGADLALLATFTLPTSSGDGFAGDTSVTFAPALAITRAFDTGLRLGANLGYRFREENMSLDLEVDDEVFGAVGVGYDLSKTASKTPVEIDAGFALATAANDMFGAFNRNYAEVKAGLNIDVPGPLLAFAATGFGVAEGWGTPDWRALAGVRVDRPQKEEPKAPKIGDTDKDGYLDNVDRCPLDPEDFDKFEDEDGCPDTDDDKDGIRDVDDKCRLEPEDFDQFEDIDGCPENDNDKDMILDVSDKCPNEPEDLDSFQDDDGCPDTDNDQDTVLDADDECKDIAGPVENKGCPWPDKDGDGVIDRFDNCPTWKGKPENNGCALPQLVKITESKLELYDATYFATGKAIIQRRSYKMLDQVAMVLKAHPELIIKIEGHTDSVGSNAMNLKLSQARAESVVKYLTKKGVDAARLSAQGFGEEQPVADNKTAKGRSANRRVEFMATRTVETTVPVQPGQPGATPAPGTAPATPAPAAPAPKAPAAPLERP